jgi:GNAT superfamily N-acetyltransferase
MRGIRLKATNDIQIRKGKPSDYENVVSVMPHWWDGRDLTSMLPKVFFIHFHNTIYIAESKNELVGFLVGFFSQSEDNVGYIHFAGVHPSYRKRGVGRLLYHKFFDACAANGRSIIQSCTSPVNKLSINFHERMGFAIEPGDGIIDNMPVTLDYLGSNNPKALFRKENSDRGALADKGCVSHKTVKGMCGTIRR